MTLLLHYPPFTHFTTKPHHRTTTATTTTKPPKLTVISQSQDPTTSNDPITETPSSGGVGFGSGSTQPPKPKPNSSSTGSIGKKNTGRRRDVIRRNPVGNPAFSGKKGNEEDEDGVRGLTESVFLVTWLGLGGLIFVEGIALSASGFLPEKWDKLFVKYIYPSFTPTVFLFVAASVVYGVIKYFENENARNPN